MVQKLDFEPSDNVPLFLLVLTLVSYQFFSLFYIRDATKPATPVEYYHILIFLYFAFVSVNMIFKGLVKNDRMGVFAALLSNSVPLTAVVLPLLIVRQVDQINGLTMDHEQRVLLLSHRLDALVPLDTVEWILNCLALLLIPFGVGMLLWCEYEFARKGQGTLSPLDEIQTQALVVDGAYAYSRNPMITGVAVLIFGVACGLQSLRTATFGLFFVLVKTIWFVTAEEPSMKRRFGKEYGAYAKQVPRWLPRWTPYRPGVKTKY